MKLALNIKILNKKSRNEVFNQNCHVCFGENLKLTKL